MNSGEIFKDLYGLQADVSGLVREGKRKPEDMLKILQLINDREDCGVALLGAPRQSSLIITFPQELWVPQWEKYYCDEHGIRVNLGPIMKAVSVAEHPEFSWPVFPIPKVGLNRAWAKCQDHYSCYSVFGNDIERAMKEHQRNAGISPYIVRFRPRVEADEENKNLSANQLKESNASCITILERILLEDFIWCLTGGFHLDMRNVTLCAGSRGSNGNVPSADWLDCQFRVRGCNPDDAYVLLRARSAV